MKPLYLMLFLSFFMASSQAEIVQYRINAVVSSSILPGVSAGDSAVVDLTYDTDSELINSDENSPNPYFSYQDLNFASSMAITISSYDADFVSTNQGFVIRVDNRADFQDPSVWTNSVHFSGFNGTSSDGVYSGLSLGTQFDTYRQKDIHRNIPSSLAAVQSGANAYHIFAFDQTQGESLFVLSGIEVIDAKPKSIDLEMTPKISTVPAEGGRIKFTRTLTNNSDDSIQFRRIEYVTFPDGFVYSRRNKRTEMAFEEVSSSRRGLNVPASWPSGTYRYTLSYITRGSAERSSVHFEFSKED